MGGPQCGKGALAQQVTQLLGREFLEMICTSISPLKQLERVIQGHILLRGTLLLRYVEHLRGPLLLYLSKMIQTIQVRCRYRR
jgi:hypothetical protein